MIFCITILNKCITYCAKCVKMCPKVSSAYPADSHLEQGPFIAKIRLGFNIRLVSFDIRHLQQELILELDGTRHGALATSTV